MSQKPTYDELASMVKDLQVRVEELEDSHEVLTLSSGWYRSLLDNVFDAIFILDEKFNYIEVNRKAVELFGYSREELLSMSVFDVIPPEQVPKSTNELEALKRRGSYEKFIGKMVCKDGRVVDIEVSSSALYEGDEIVGSVDIVRDITERLKVDREVRYLKQQIEYILAATRTGIAVIDRGYNLRYVDPGWQTIYGDYAGSKCFKYFKARKSVCPDCVISMAFDRKLTVVAEDILPLEGNRPVQITAIPFENEEGELLVAQVHADITSRKEIEDALKESEGKYRAITDTATDAIIMIDGHGHVNFWNSAAEKYFGYSSDEILGQELHALCVPDDYSKGYHEGLKRFRQAGDGAAIGTTLELIGRRKDGSTFPFELSLSSLKIKNTWNALGILRDISERKKVEEELDSYRNNLEGLVHNRTEELLQTNTLLKEKIRQRNEAEEARKATENKYRRLVDNLKEDYFMFSLDADGIFTYLSPSVQNVLGFAFEEDLPHFSRIFNSQSERARIDEFTRKCLAGQTLSSYEIEVFHQDGTEHWLEISQAPILDARADIVGVEGIAHDITTRKKIEKELLKTQKLESTGLLAGGIAHDFNNLLTAIVGNISLAKIHADPDSKVFKKLVEIEKASGRARDLTQQLLTFSKGGAPVTKPQSISEMVKDSAWFTLRGSNVKCEFINVDHLWPVEADEGQICQVIQNIATNADQAMPDGGILRITGENVEIYGEGSLSLKSGKYVKLTFLDTGCGISEEHIDKIFDPYFTTKQKGNGLGLSICYSIIKNHKGSMQVESVLSRGTIFTLYLPASSAELRIKEKEEFMPVHGSGRILIMDDEEIVRDIGCEMLSHLGYEPSTVNDGAEAIAAYGAAMEKGDPFRAVIMDLTIPGGMGGKEALSRILALDPKVKAIVSSGYANDEIMARFREYGFKDIIPKPYKIDDLAVVLGKILQEQETS